jgi:hypothetical protein
MLTAIISVCKALEALFLFLATKEGQTFCQEYRQNRDQAHAWLAARWAEGKVNLSRLPQLWTEQPAEARAWWQRLFN